MSYEDLWSLLLNYLETGLGAYQHLKRERKRITELEYVHSSEELKKQKKKTKKTFILM